MSETYIARAKAVAARALGGEMMVMSALDSTVFALDEISTLIWKAADGSTPLREIVRRGVCAAYEVSEEVALRDAQDLCQQLAQSGILRTSDQPIIETEAR